MLDNCTCTAAALCRKPLYAIGDAVMVQTVTEDGVLTDFGTILGIEIDPDYSFIKGWWYSVHFTFGHSAGYRDWIPEDDITNLTIH